MLKKYYQLQNTVLLQNTSTFALSNRGCNQKGKQLAIWTSCGTVWHKLFPSHHMPYRQCSSLIPIHAQDEPRCFFISVQSNHKPIKVIRNVSSDLGGIRKCHVQLLLIAVSAFVFQTGKPKPIQNKIQFVQPQLLLRRVV